MRPSPYFYSPPNGRRSRRGTQAFTLVEMLVVVLILAILMAVALPLYLAAIKETARRTARGNLHTWINAEQTYRVKIGNYTNNKADLIIGPTSPNGVIDRDIVGPGNTEYTLFAYDEGDRTLPDGRPVPQGGVAACANDTRLGADGDYGCFIPGQDHE